MHAAFTATQIKQSYPKGLSEALDKARNEVRTSSELLLTARRAMEGTTGGFSARRTTRNMDTETRLPTQRTYDDL